MDDEKVDFAALDPSRDRLRWERMVRSVAARAAEAAPAPVSLMLVRWRRGVLAACALLAAGAWLPAWLAEPAAEAHGAPHALAEWAEHDDVPDDVDITEALAEAVR